MKEDTSPSGAGGQPGLSPAGFEDEIDLRAYLDVLIRRWRWIVGLTMLAALVAGIVSFTMTPKYEATAQLAVLTTSDVSLLASPTAQLAVLTTSDVSLLASPTAQLAVLQSPVVATQTLQSLGAIAANENPSTLARKVRVANDRQDKKLFYITAQANAPQKAAAIANAWAEAGMKELNRRLIANVSAVREQQAQLALLTLQQADESLASFVQSNGLTWDEVASFEATMSVSSPRLFMPGSSKPLNLSAAQVTGLSRLLRDRDIAASVYVNLATQAAQSKIAAQMSTEGAQLVSSAVEPAIPIQPKPLQNIAIAGVLGLMLGVFGAFALEYFAQPRR